MTTTNITLTFDDAYDVHLDLVVPCLNRHRLSGTFYVDLLSDVLLRRSSEWRLAADDGHELGNHSLFHPGYPPASHIREGNDLARYTLDRMSLELELANRLLTQIDGRLSRTFAYPNANPILGDVGYVKRLLRLLGWDRTRIHGWVDDWGIDFGATRRNYIPVVERLFFAARGGTPGDWSQPFNRYFVPSFAGDGKSLDELLQFVNRTVETGSWGVFMFHKIGPDPGFSCDADVCRQFVSRLAGDSRIAVKTFFDAACELWPRAEPARALVGDGLADYSARIDAQDVLRAPELTAANRIAGY